MTPTDSLLLGLNRPQYAPTSEVLVSSLVHAVREPAAAPGSDGYRFLNRDPDSPRPVTAPSTTEELGRFADTLEHHHLRTDASPALLATAVLHAVTGVAGGKGTSLPASPMSQHLALAQDLCGVLGAKNPPNLGRALEQMFLMGATEPRDDATMASLWLRSASTRARHEPLLAAIDHAVAATHPAGSFHERPPSTPPSNQWAAAFPESPYGWLNSSWRRLMDERWVDRLPTRVWTDWATTVLRTGLAFGYLAEMRWYELIGRQLLADEPVRALPTLRGQELLPWSPARLPIHSRNVKTEIRQSVDRGTSVLEVLNTRRASTQSSATHTDATTSPALVAELEDLRHDEDLRAQLRTAMGGQQPPKSAKNTYETIIYALQQRGGATAGDYYGLIKAHGPRYSVVAPGTEWIAVVASLCCGDGDETNVGEVARSLGRLGLKPELQELVGALEAAGMARGSADADHGVRVRSAF